MELLGFVLKFWLRLVGPKLLAAGMGVGVVIAIVLNYTT